MSNIPNNQFVDTIFARLDALVKETEAIQLTDAVSIEARIGKIDEITNLRDALSSVVQKITTEINAQKKIVHDELDRRIELDNQRIESTRKMKAILNGEPTEKVEKPQEPEVFEKKPRIEKNYAAIAKKIIPAKKVEEFTSDIKAEVSQTLVVPKMEKVEVAPKVLIPVYMINYPDDSKKYPGAVCYIQQEKRFYTCINNVVIKSALTECFGQKVIKHKDYKPFENGVIPKSENTTFRVPGEMRMFSNVIHYVQGDVDINAYNSNRNVRVFSASNLAKDLECISLEDAQIAFDYAAIWVLLAPILETKIRQLEADARKRPNYN